MLHHWLCSFIAIESIVELLENALRQLPLPQLTSILLPQLFTCSLKPTFFLRNWTQPGRSREGKRCSYCWAASYRTPHLPTRPPSVTQHWLARIGIHCNGKALIEREVLGKKWILLAKAESKQVSLLKHFHMLRWPCSWSPSCLSFELGWAGAKFQPSPKYPRKERIL